MALWWAAAGMLEAERQFRRVIGYRDLAKLAGAIERDRGERRDPITAPPPDRGASETRAMKPSQPSLEAER